VAQVRWFCLSRLLLFAALDRHDHDRQHGVSGESGMVDRLKLDF
jgi:hypothetical protein